MDIQSAKTVKLVDELKSREGVDARIIAPYELVTLEVEGPAIVLTIID